MIPISLIARLRAEAIATVLSGKPSAAAWKFLLQHGAK